MLRTCYGKPGVTVYPGKRPLCKKYIFIHSDIQSSRLVPSPNRTVSAVFCFRKVFRRTKIFSRFWTSEFESFYNPKTGFDIDGAWIDMNEPASVRRRIVPVARA